MKKSMIGLPYLWIFCLALLFTAVPQSASFALEINLHNDSSESLHTAAVYYDDTAGAWITRGWYVAGPGQRNTVTLPTSKPTVYLHSFISDEAKTSWGEGHIVRMVISQDFTYKDGEKCPAGSEMRRAQFTRFEAENNQVDYRPVKTPEPLPTAGEWPEYPELSSGDKDGAGRTPTQEEARLARAAADLVDLINYERVSSGLKPMVTNEAMAGAALTRALEMRVKFDIVTRPDGRGYDTVLSDNGMVFARTRTSGGGADEADAPEIFKAFFAHEVTRNFMLAKEHTHMGAGICPFLDGYYIVLLFGGGHGGVPTERGLAGAVDDLERTVDKLKDIERKIRRLGDLF